jgi:hypothetical protein
MARTTSSNTASMPQMSPEEMRGLAARLRVRPQSALPRRQPEQHCDLLTAASLIERFADLSAEILSSASVIERLARLLGIAGGA